MEKNYDGVNIHEAAANGKGGWCEELLAQGEDVNSMDQLGWTPLMHAVHNGHSVLARDLLSHGAQVSITNNHGITAFTMGILIFDEDLLNTIYKRLTPELRRQESNMALQAACVLGLYKVVDWLLQNTPAQVNFISPLTGVTPLMLVAMCSGDCEVAELLLKSGADLNIQTPLGQDVLDLALTTGNDKLFSLLHQTFTKLPLKNHSSFEKVKTNKSDSIDLLFTTNKINLDVQGDVVLKNSPARPVFKNGNENLSTQNDYKKSVISSSMKSVFLPSPQQRLSQSWDHDVLSCHYNLSSIATPRKFVAKTPNKAKKRKLSTANSISSWFKKVTKRRSKSLAAEDDDYDDMNIQQRNGVDFLDLLKGLGLDEYFPVFKDQELDIWTFLTLTVQDLAAMGIEKPSSQIRILEGIQALRTTHI